MSSQDEFQNLSQAQINVEGAKFDQHHLGENEQLSRKIDLPSSYGKDRIILMVRDPWWIFCYWEITLKRQREVKAEMEKRGHHFDRTVIRIYDITGVKDFNGRNANSLFDITLRDMAKNWYVDVSAPNRTWCIEIGIISKEGEFYPIVRSNIVQTPRFGMSDILDDKWMLSEEEYWWLFGASGGLDVGKSSMEMKEMFQRYLQEWVTSGAWLSSGGMFSLGSHIFAVTHGVNE